MGHSNRKEKIELSASEKGFKIDEVYAFKDSDSSIIDSSQKKETNTERQQVLDMESLSQEKKMEDEYNIYRDSANNDKESKKKDFEFEEKKVYNHLKDNYSDEMDAYLNNPTHTESPQISHEVQNQSSPDRIDFWSPQESEKKNNYFGSYETV